MQQRVLFILALSFIYYSSTAQCNTYRLNDRGDTLNCTDIKNLKQGKWVIHVDELRGNPGYDEEGVYKDNGKIGRWKRYSVMGDLLAIENYKWGVKDSLQQYYFQNKLEHEEMWHASDPSKRFDTVYVPDFYEEHKMEKKIIKVETQTVKNGVWKYYKPGSLAVIKADTYVLGELINPRTEYNQNTTAIPAITKDTSSTTSIKKDTSAAKLKPKAVQDFEKKNAGKKTKYIDGSIKY